MLWFDAADFSTLFFGSGNSVKAWIDKGPMGLAAVQATAANQPIYAPVAVNGKPALQFVRTSPSGLITPAVFNPQQWSGFAVINKTTTTGFQEIICARGPFGSFYADYIALSSSNTAIQAFNTVGGVFAAPSLAFTNGATVILSGVRNGGQVSAAVNGGSFSSATTTGTPQSGNFAVSIGCDSPFSGTNTYDGYISECIVCRRAYDGSAGTPPLHLIVPAYLAWKYGLQANLPVTRPFKNSPP